LNDKFIPVVFDESHKAFIPTPLQGATCYCVATPSGHEDLYRRLTNQPKIERPQLGPKRALAEKKVKTNPSLFVFGPIDVDLWNQAQWRATFFAGRQGMPPVLGLAYKDGASARKIFEGWHKRYGVNDDHEELRVSIVEGHIKGKEPGYTVHIGCDPDVVTNRLREAGYPVDDGHFAFVSRLNRMNPPPDSRNLELFKRSYREHKTYYLAPGVLSDDGTLTPMFELGIYKARIHFRHVSEIGTNDVDRVVISPDGESTPSGAPPRRPPPEGSKPGVEGASRWTELSKWLSQDLPSVRRDGLTRWRQLHAEGHVPPQAIIDRAVELVIAGNDDESYPVLELLLYNRAEGKVQQALARLAKAFVKGRFDAKPNAGSLLANATAEIDEAFKPILAWLEKRPPWSAPVEWAFSGLWGWARRDVDDPPLKTRRIKRARHICDLYPEQDYAKKLLNSL